VGGGGGDWSERKRLDSIVLGSGPILTLNQATARACQENHEVANNL
jgi:hypothetical protein